MLFVLTNTCWRHVVPSSAVGAARRLRRAIEEFKDSAGEWWRHFAGELTSISKALALIAHADEGIFDQYRAQRATYGLR